MRRKNYYNYFTKGDWGKKNTYDLILNSSKLGVEGTVDILCSLYRNFMVSWISLVAPGFGQIYNKQYWKLPILYGTVGAGDRKSVV